MSDPDLIPASPSAADYARAAPAIAPLPDDADPVALFEAWLREADAAEPNDPNAMTLATVDETGAPDARMVLLKGVDAGGFVFYSNDGSAKGRELATQPQACLLFHWKSLRRQVRVRGTAGAVSEAEADAYFASRARVSQLGAWASDQSQTLDAYSTLEKRLAEAEVRFGDGPVPRPPHWRGWRLAPASIEFWRDRPFRLHERLVFERREGGWVSRRLYP